jgi:hypothetical protein
VEPRTCHHCGDRRLNITMAVLRKVLSSGRSLTSLLDPVNLGEVLGNCVLGGLVQVRPTGILTVEMGACRFNWLIHPVPQFQPRPPSCKTFHFFTPTNTPSLISLNSTIQCPWISPLYVGYGLSPTF